GVGVGLGSMGFAAFYPSDGCFLWGWGFGVWANEFAPTGLRGWGLCRVEVAFHLHRAGLRWAAAAWVALRSPILRGQVWAPPGALALGQKS
ncbi:hypothetical protein DMX10_32070, partial [Pseudomonas sp. 57B-090624]